MEINDGLTRLVTVGSRSVLPSGCECLTRSLGEERLRCWEKRFLLRKETQGIKARVLIKPQKQSKGRKETGLESRGEF